MVAYNKFQDFVEQLGLGVHDLDAAAHVLKVALTNTAPVATNTILGNITQIASGNGYTTDGEDTTNTWSETGGTATLGATDVVWTAGPSAMAQFRYVVTHNDTQTTPVKPLVCWWDNGSAVDLANGESFTVDFQSDQIFTLT